ncbi:MAG: hypothetical protein M1827_001053 [Pycnora praestabilis]|nr:MAG: hypothetical protein M1827_001053 [Pycnora praestabilis]
MPKTPPFRSQPNLHLMLTPPYGSPDVFHQSTPSTSPFTTLHPDKKYSPFSSTAFKPFKLYGSSAQYSPRPPAHTSCTSHGLKRVLARRPVWFALILIGLISWWNSGGRLDTEAVKLKSNGLGREVFLLEMSKQLQFFPASNPKIHYVGRWTATPNRLRRDGVYFDIMVTNTTTLLLSLHNSATVKSDVVVKGSKAFTGSASPTLNLGHLSFHPSPDTHEPAAPVSLLARIDQEEYILLPNSSALVSVRTRTLNANEVHNIRIVAPMIDGSGSGVLEFEGLWLENGGKLLRVAGSQLADEVEEEDAFQAESSTIGEKHRLGLLEFRGGGDSSEIELKKGDLGGIEDNERTHGERRKLLEVVTDSPGSLGGKYMGKRTGGAAGLLAGVMGWEYLLGEMFGVDHVQIGADGMCLMQDCVGGIGNPAGMGDVFFRSGLVGSEYFAHPWMFNAYIPDVMIIHVGGSDHESFTQYLPEYNRTAWDLSQRFEDTYVSLIKAIRQLAYPKHPSVAHSGSLGSDTYSSNTAPASIPIFVMRPLRGQLEHATQGAVNRLRADGDKAVFWLDTSGWLDTEDTTSDDQDFYLDESTGLTRWRLTERSNQRVAIFLHMHVCRYLAGQEDKCAFLPPEVYQGKVFTPESANFDRYLENEKERKLKKLFWNE